MPFFNGFCVSRCVFAIMHIESSSGNQTYFPNVKCLFVQKLRQYSLAENRLLLFAFIIINLKFFLGAFYNSFQVANNIKHSCNLVSEY